MSHWQSVPTSARDRTCIDRVRDRHEAFQLRRQNVIVEKKPRLRLHIVSRGLELTGFDG
jgi:hypothetical protein